jgi:hypothetical protein
MTRKKVVEVKPEVEQTSPGIAKPEPFSMKRFQSKRDPSIAGVEVLPTALPVMKLADAHDFARLHPDEAYWSLELCFVSVPIKGQKRDVLHLIEEDIAAKYLNWKQVRRFQLVLASKPYDVFFLCIFPTQNIDNGYNDSARIGCQEAKHRWVKLDSRRDEGVDSYRITYTQEIDAFPEPNWPKQSIDELIGIAFPPHQQIVSEDHPALLRLIGAKQKLS